MLISRLFLRRLLASSLISAGIMMILLLIIIGYQRSQISVRSQAYLRKIIQRDFPEEFQNSQGLRFITEKITVEDGHAVAIVKVSQLQSWVKTTLQLSRNATSGWQVQGIVETSSAGSVKKTQDSIQQAKKQDHSLNEELKTAFGGAEDVIIERY